MVERAASAETAGEDATVSKRTQILAGAARVFAADGYEGASMSRIAAEATVSKGTLYNYYTSKADLFAAYVEGVCSHFIAVVFDDLDHGRPPGAVLKQVGSRMCLMLLSEQALVMHRMVVAEAGKFPELAQTFYDSGPARAIGHLSAYLAQATRDGRLAIADTTFASEQFFALIQTRLYMRRQLRLTGMPSQEQLDHVVDSAVRLFLAAYATPSGQT